VLPFARVNPFSRAFFGGFMKRFSVNKNQSAKKFSGQMRKTKAVNMAGPPMRGGFRL